MLLYTKNYIRRFLFITLLVPSGVFVSAQNVFDDTTPYVKRTLNTNVTNNLGAKPANSVNYAKAREVVYLKDGFRLSATGLTQSAVIKADYSIVPTMTDPYGVTTKDPAKDYYLDDPDFMDSFQYPNSSFSVGNTDGSIDISPSGAAVYNVPIKIAPGTRGVEPKLSVAYNSQSGNGVMGWGWNIGGLSAITRVAQTPYYDGQTIPVTLSPTDRFALDGSRLLVQSGAYGANASVYETEVKSFSTITSYGTSGSGPAYFTVITRDGQTIEYGNSTDSKYIPNSSSSTVMMWRINKVTDNDGNSMLYHYKTIDGEHVIDYIEYTLNVNNTVATTYNKVLFEYSRKLDNNTLFVKKNYQINESRALLRRIVSVGNGKVVRKYTFDYFLDFYSRLYKITETGSDGAQLNPLIFQWKQGNSDIIKYAQHNNNSGAITDDLNIPVSNFNTVGDFNGDGLSDVFQCIQEQATAYIHFSKSDGKFSSVAVDLGSLDINYHNGQLKTVYVYDSNTDGRDEIVVASIKDGQNQIRHSRITVADAPAAPSGYSFAVNVIDTHDDRNIVCYVGDFNGDKIPEVLVYNDDNIYRFIGGFNPDLSATTNNFAQMKLLDMNGNGKTDILMVKNDTYRVYEYDNASNKMLEITVLNPGLTDDDDIIYPGDYNGDGKTDLLVYYDNDVSPTKWATLYSLSDQFYGVFMSTAFNPDPGKILIGDFNSDGKEDFASLISVGNSYYNLQYFYSQNLNYVTNGAFGVQFSFDSWSQPNFLTGDFDNSGSTDIFFLDHTAAYLIDRPVIIMDRNYGSSRVITDIYNSMGLHTGITYSALNKIIDPDFYATSATPAFPVVNTKGPMLAVKTISSPDGIGGIRNMQYKYRDARIHLNGKGFLGFLKVIANDPLTNTQTEKTFANDASNYHISLVKSETYVNNNLIGRTTNTPLQFTYAGSLSYFPYPSSSLSEVFQPGATTAYASYTTTNTYLDNGDLTYQKKVSATPLVTGESSEEHSYTYQSYGNTRRPKTESATITYKGGSTYTENASYEYSAVGRLLSGKKFPDTKYEIKTEQLSWDTYGNPTQIKTTVATPDNTTAVDPRSVTYTYDTYGRFVTSTTNDLGYVSSSEYDPATGFLRSSTDIDKQKTYYTYDGLGNMVKQTLPNGANKYYTKGWGWTNLTGSSYFTRTSADGEPTVTTYYDWLGREMQTEMESFGGTVYTKKTYDAYGRLKNETLPAYTAPDNSQLIEYGYDDPEMPGWLVSVKKQGIETKYQYNGLTKTTKYPDNTIQVTENYAFGKLKTTTDAKNNVVSYIYHGSGQPEIINAMGSTKQFYYNDYGYQIQATDPNAMNPYYYRYNAFGELVWQKTPRNFEFNLTYDPIGRLVQRAGSQKTINYSYNNSGNGIGQLSLAAVAGGGPSQSFAYDEKSRMTGVTENIPGHTAFTTAYTYDGLDRINEITYPSGFKISHTYDTKGYVTEIKRSDNSASLWKLNSINALGQPVSYQYGNGLTTNMGYDTYHNPSTIQAVRSDGSFVHNYSVAVNANTGNITGRNDVLNGQSETFHYDELDRLDKITRNGIDYAIGFDNKSCITAKYDAGTAYNYKPDQIYAIDYISGNSGISANTQNISYNEFDKIAGIDENNNAAAFTYGPDDQRSYMDESTGNVLNKRTYYTANYEVVHDYTTGNEKQIHYIDSPTGTVGVYLAGNAQAGMYYAHTDHLGTLNVLSNEAGQVAERYSFDAWGRRRNPLNWDSYTLGSAPALLTRGFTMHEHLDNFELINMNGRLYDPRLGQFLSVDPAGQTVNPYAYCANNPLRFTDPSGELFIADDILEGMLVAAIAGGLFNSVSRYQQGQSFGQVAANFGIGAVGGAATAGIAGGIGSELLGAAAETFGGGAVAGAGGAMVGDLATQTLNYFAYGESFSLQQLGLSAAVGGITGGLGASRGIGKGSKIDYTATPNPTDIAGGTIIYAKQPDGSILVKQQIGTAWIVIDKIPAPKLEGYVSPNVEAVNRTFPVGTGRADFDVGGQFMIGGLASSVTKVFSSTFTKAAAEEGIQFGENVLSTTTRVGKNGNAVEVLFKNGGKMDINAARVKEWVPNLHPNAPAGTLNKVKFDNFLPGSKGFKRLPTQGEMDFLNSLFN